MVGDVGVSSDADTPATTSFQVTVTNGFGSGMYEAGSTVHVWSDHNPRTQVVTTWSGDSDILADNGEWHTSFVMPARNLTLNAELVDSSFQLIKEQFDGRDRTKTVRYFIPVNPVGLVHITHGTERQRLSKGLSPDTSLAFLCTQAMVFGRLMPKR